MCLPGPFYYTIALLQTVNEVSLFESSRLLEIINVASPEVDEHSLIKQYVNQLHENSRSV